LLRADAGLAWARGATQQEGERTRPVKKKTEGGERGGLKGKNELGPCFVPKFSLQLRKC